MSRKSLGLGSTKKQRTSTSHQTNTMERIKTPVLDIKESSDTKTPSLPTKEPNLAEHGYATDESSSEDEDSKSSSDTEEDYYGTIRRTVNKISMVSLDDIHKEDEAETLEQNRVISPREILLALPPPGRHSNSIREESVTTITIHKQDGLLETQITERTMSAISTGSYVSLTDSTSTISPITPATPSMNVDVESRILLDNVIDPAIKHVVRDFDGEQLRVVEMLRQMFYDTEDVVPGFTKRFIENLNAKKDETQQVKKVMVEPVVQHTAEQIPLWQPRIDEDECKLRQTPIAKNLLKRWRNKFATDETNSSLINE